MQKQWSVRRRTSLALLLSFVSVLPLVFVVYGRLGQIHKAVPPWLPWLRAAHELESGASCTDSVTEQAAPRRILRWSLALTQLLQARPFAENQQFARAAIALRDEASVVSAASVSEVTTWVTEHCRDVSLLGQQAWAIGLGSVVDVKLRSGDPTSLALRDVTAYLAVWLVFSLGLLVWMRRSVVRPARQLARVMLRVADGDLSADIPMTAGGETLELARFVQRAMDRFEDRERAQAERILEMRDLVRRLLEQLDAPVLIVGRLHTIDYANEAAARTFGEPLDQFVGVELARLPGGEAVITVVDEILREGEAHSEHVVSTGSMRRAQHVARCALVRDPHGSPTRVIMVLAAADSGWWRRLFDHDDAVANA